VVLGDVFTLTQTSAGCVRLNAPQVSDALAHDFFARALAEIPALVNLLCLQR
jgi:hypothetical protein